MLHLKHLIHNSRKLDRNGTKTGTKSTRLPIQCMTLTSGPPHEMNS